MRKFDLNEALRNQEKNLDPGVITRDGRKVEQIAHFPNAHYRHEVYAKIKGTPTPLPCLRDGTPYLTHGNNIILFMAPKTKTFWVNLYDHQGPKANRAYYYDSEQTAINCMDTNEKIIGNKPWPVTIEIE